MRRDGLAIPYTIMENLFLGSDVGLDVEMVVDCLREEVVNDKNALEKHKKLTERFYANQVVCFHG